MSVFRQNKHFKFKADSEKSTELESVSLSMIWGYLIITFKSQHHTDLFQTKMQILK